MSEGRGAVREGWKAAPLVFWTQCTGHVLINEQWFCSGVVREGRKGSEDCTGQMGGSGQNEGY